jgi:MFS family permease
MINYHVLCFLLCYFQIGISLSYVLWCVSFNLTIFMLARIVGGFSKANVAIILAIVSDTTTEKERNRAMVRRKNNSTEKSFSYFFKAWIGAAFSLGFIFGPLLGALCSQLGIAYWPNSSVSFFIFPAGVSLVLSLINIGFINAYCPETLPISKRVCHLNIDDILVFIYSIG